jgi:RNA polymerase sigma factor (sigma-70 family)
MTNSGDAERIARSRLRAELMRRMQRGDPDACRALLDDIGASLTRFLRRRIADPNELEDVYQEVLMAVFEARHTYQPNRPFEPWLFAIARNVTADSLRRRWSRAKWEELVADAPEQPADDSSLTAPDLVDVLAQIPADQREAFELLKVDGLPVAAAAEQAGVSVAALKVRAPGLQGIEEVDRRIMPGTPYITHEEHHRALVTQLAGRVRPVQPLWPVGLRLLLWLGLECAVLAWVIVHARSDFSLKLVQVRYILEFVSFGAAAVLAAWMALESAIPGRLLRPAEALLCGVLPLTGTALIMFAQPPNVNYQLGQFVKVGVPCALLTCALAILPWMFLCYAVRRGAPLRGAISGLWAGAGALLFAFAMMRLLCPIDEPLHVIAWHLLPALAAIALSVVAGSRWLSFRFRLLRHARGDR